MSISISLIIKRNLRKKLLESLEKSHEADLLKLSHVRLDREDLDAIDNLDCLGSVTNLYLQTNNITKIQNLEFLAKTLRFLTLAENRISKVEGLLSLQELKFLDLSNNLIEDLHLNQLPQSLLFVSFKNNKCCMKPDYRQSIIDHLKNVKSIDEELIEESDEESDSDSDDTEDCNEKLKQTSNDLLLRSLSRIDEVAVAHKKNLLELDKQRENAVQSLNDDKNSSLSALDARIQTLMQSMIQAKTDVLDDFDISTFNPQISFNNIESTENLTLADEAQSAKQEKRPLSKADKPLKTKPKQMVTTGTTTSGYSTSGNFSKRERRMVGTGNSLKSAKRVNTRLTTDTLVRIPGARPFHKP